MKLKVELYELRTIDVPNRTVVIKNVLKTLTLTKKARNGATK
jgi:hypothetical protein